MIVPSSSQFEIQLLHHRTKVASEVHIVASTFSHGRSTHAFLNYRVITWWSGVPNGAKSCACKSTRVSEGETPYPPTACINSKMWDSLAKTIKSTNQAEVKKRKLWVSPLEDEKTEEEWQPSMKGKWMAANQRREPEQSQDGMAPRKDSCHGQSSQSTSASKKTTAAGIQTEKGSQNPKNDPKFELLTDWSKKRMWIKEQGVKGIADIGRIRTYAGKAQ